MKRPLSKPAPAHQGGKRRAPFTIGSTNILPEQRRQEYAIANIPRSGLAESDEARYRLNSAHPARKEKIKHELWEMVWLFLYLAFFFCALVAYDTLLLNQYQVQYWNFGFALLNAALITKVIMIGEYAKLGSRHESKALIISILWKSLIFGLLVFAFHIVEELVKRLIHGANLETASRHLRFDQVGGRAIVVFCTFVPLFAFREFRRVMGEEEFRTMLFGSGKK